MNITQVYEHIIRKQPNRVVLQFTNHYLPTAKEMEADFISKLPNVKFYISADK